MLPITIKHVDSRYIKFTFAMDEIRVKIPNELGYCKATVESMVTSIYNKIEGYPITLRGKIPLGEQALHIFTITLKDNTGGVASRRIPWYKVKVRFDDVEVTKLEGRDFDNEDTDK